MPIRTTRHNAVEIAYETFGSPDGEPLLLIMGTAMQMVMWPDELCSMLAGHGFAVARFDNRDAGLSTHFSEAGRPGLAKDWFRAGRTAAYRLEDMSDDALAVMDALGWSSAHLFGASLGGAIAQLTAIRHPERVRSLTVSSSYAGWKRGRVNMRTVLRLMLSQSLRRYPAGREGAVQRVVDAMRILGSPGYPLDEAWWRHAAGLSYERDSSPAGGEMRQSAAAGATGDLLPRLAAVDVPTLVVHGEDDPMIRPRSAKEIADAVPGARLVLYPGMGHDLPRELWPAVVDEVRAVAGRTQPASD
ncbi:alpha/beta hydrolase [Microbispora corallina]|uniref:Alpha/beta hydrolase n=1 Tax=Microbispora corallina TaxID=83302 RepID=A0ABQ4GBU1_9ACTN|nr:alpha/beta fold hydrolase [Microbispora corallina]GIH44570.1 alpha/beta hydrolase [Microbispora corallina]